MPRPLARSLTRALVVIPGGAPRPYVRRRTPQRSGSARTSGLRDRAAAPRPRDYAALALGAKRALRAATLRDCGRRCVYCATALTFDTVTLDHVHPRSQGGPNVAGNVVAACGPCNRLKADLLPAEFFRRHPWAGLNFMRLARTVHRSLKRGARRAVSLACAADDAATEVEFRAAA